MERNDNNNNFNLPSYDIKEAVEAINNTINPVSEFRLKNLFDEYEKGNIDLCISGHTVNIRGVFIDRSIVRSSSFRNLF
jgi:hypothetical protein